MKKKKLKKEIYSLRNEINDIHDAILTWDKKVNRIDDKLNHVDERTMALDNVKINNWVDHTKQLEDKIKILMDRTSTNYNACSDTGITFENCYQIYRCMADRGATQEELNNLKDYFNRYIFRSRLFKIYKTDQEMEEKNDD